MLLRGGEKHVVNSITEVMLSAKTLAFALLPENLPEIMGADHSGGLQRAKPSFDNEVAAILARLRRSRIVCSDETSVRIDGRTHWNWVFQNDQVVIHVVRNSRAANVVTETMAGHRPSIWVSDLYGAQQGHADLWQVCLAHQLRDCKYAPGLRRGRLSRRATRSSPHA